MNVSREFDSAHQKKIPPGVLKEAAIQKNSLIYLVLLKSKQILENWESDFSSFAKIFEKDIFQGLFTYYRYVI